MDRRDELIQLIGEEIYNSEKVSQRDWESLSLVFDLSSSSVSNSGFLYQNGSIVPISVRSFRLAEYVQELHEVTEVDGKERWKQCLVQIRKKDGAIKLDFEYNDADRWSITPANRLEMRESLRPNFE